MARVFSFSVPDSESELIEYLNHFKETGSLSKLIITLLKNYFFGDADKKSLVKAIVEVKQLKAQLAEWLEKGRELEEKILNLEKELQEKQEEKQTEEDLTHIRILREVYFDDIEKILSAFSNGKHHEAARWIKTRLNAFASERGLTLPHAKQLFFKAFPDLKEKLEVVL